MLETAERRGYMPIHLRGKTMYKIMLAHLAEYIRLKSGQAIFHSTSPNTFFLHSLAKDPTMPAELKGVCIGNLRTKAIKKEEVLVASKRELEHRLYGDSVPFEEEGFLNLYRDHCRFLGRGMAEGDKSVKQFVTFTLVVHDSKILTHRRGKFSTASETLKARLA